MQTFLNNFCAFINKWKLVDILGICSLREGSIDDPVSVEFTSGRASITLLFDVALDDGDVVDAIWQFSSGPPRRIQAALIA